MKTIKRENYSSTLQVVSTEKEEHVNAVTRKKNKL